MVLLLPYEYSRSCPNSRLVLMMFDSKKNLYQPLQGVGLVSQLEFDCYCCGYNNPKLKINL